MLDALQNRRAPIRVRVATSGNHRLANSIIWSIMAFCLHKSIADTSFFNTNYFEYFIETQELFIEKSYIKPEEENAFNLAG